jgi:hypothetical protein
MRKRQPKPTLAKHHKLTEDVDAQLARLEAKKQKRELEQLKDKLGLELTTETIIANLKRDVAELTRLLTK